MTLVENMPQGLLAWTPPAVQNSELDERLRIQNAYIAINVIRRQLKEENISWQSSRHNPALFTHEAIAESGIPDVCDTICRGIAHLRLVAADEILSMIQTLELGDSGLYDSYTRIGRNMSDGVSFGRIVTFLYFTSVLCKKLHRDNRQKLVESVVEWLIEHLNEAVSPWLESNHDGQWSKIQERVNVDQVINRPVPQKGNHSTSWATAAALGVGAFLVGLALR